MSIEKDRTTVRLHKKDMEELADMTAERVMAAQGQLLNLKELAGVLGIAYGTLAKKSGLPCYCGRGGRKMYNASEVAAFLGLSVKGGARV